MASRYPPRSQRPVLRDFERLFGRARSHNSYVPPQDPTISEDDDLSSDGEGSVEEEGSSYDDSGSESSDSSEEEDSGQLHGSHIAYMYADGDEDCICCP